MVCWIKIVVMFGLVFALFDMFDVMLRVGVDVVWLNLLYFSVEEYLVCLVDVWVFVVRVGCYVVVLVDLFGSKVRSGIFFEGGVYLVLGFLVCLVFGFDLCIEDFISVDYLLFCEDLWVGDMVILGDGVIIMKVEIVLDGGVVARVMSGGWV